MKAGRRGGDGGGDGGCGGEDDEGEDIRATPRVASILSEKVRLG